MNIIRSIQLGSAGHILREDGVEKEKVLLGRVESRKSRGRQEIRYMVELIRLAKDRQRWRSLIAHVKLYMAPWYRVRLDQNYSHKTENFINTIEQIRRSVYLPLCGL